MLYYYILKFALGKRRTSVTDMYSREREKKEIMHGWNDIDS